MEETQGHKYGVDVPDKNVLPVTDFKIPIHRYRSYTGLIEK